MSPSPSPTASVPGLRSERISSALSMPSTSSRRGMNITFSLE